MLIEDTLSTACNCIDNDIAELIAQLDEIDV